MVEGGRSQAETAKPAECRQMKFKEFSYKEGPEFVQRTDRYLESETGKFFFYIYPSDVGHSFEIGYSPRAVSHSISGTYRGVKHDPAK
jgi:hypothetical protein